MAGISDQVTDVLLFLLASPTLAALALRRSWRKYKFYELASKPFITCQCGERLAMLGLWQCQCRFVYRGHLITRCPVCHSVPAVLRCYRCGVTTKLPEPE